MFNDLAIVIETTMYSKYDLICNKGPLLSRHLHKILSI